MYFGVTHWNVGMTMQEGKEKIAKAALWSFQGNKPKAAESLGIQAADLDILLQAYERRCQREDEQRQRLIAENTKNLYYQKHGRDVGITSNAPDILRTAGEKKKSAK